MENEFASGTFYRNRLAIAEARIAEAKSTGSETLDLSGLMLRSIPDSVESLRYLTTLKIGDNGIRVLPDWLVDMNNLASLDVSWNKLGSLPEWLSELRNLRSLDVGWNHLQYLPNWIASLVNLESLCMNGNPLGELPNLIEDLSRISELHAGFCRIGTLPIWLPKLSGLQSLDLSGNELGTLPECIGNMVDLRHLDIGGNNLITLPEWLPSLKVLSFLGISNNGLRTLPVYIAEFEKLSSLDISRNNLVFIPEWFKDVPPLEALDVGWNELGQLPSWLSVHRNIVSLDISGNRLDKVPEWMSGLSKLALLDISNNRLQELPSWLADLEHLASLDISRCGISTVPKWINKMTRLMSINISGNDLSSLPDWLNQLEHLTSIYAGDNNLSSLPVSISSCAIGVLWLGGNSGLSIDSGLLDNTSDPDAIYEALYAEQKQPLNEVRVAVLGEGAVGKSTLVNWLIYRRRMLTSQTEKIDILPWHINIDGQDVTARIWDFGGQQIYQATHSFFLSKRTVYILVLSSRLSDDQNQIHKWLKTISTIASDAPILVVKNKWGSIPLALAENKLKEQYPRIVDQGFIDFDGSSGHGCELVDHVLETVIRNMEFVFKPLPITCINLKNEISMSGEPYLIEKQYLDICRNNEVSDALVDPMRENLNDLGIAQSFRHKDSLLYILNPNWVINGVYNVINAPASVIKNGVLLLDKMLGLLPKENYREWDISIIIGVMEKAELCNRFSSSGKDALLIPELAQKDQPSTDFDASITYFFRYEVLLEGLMPKLIVRHYDLLDANTYWHTGMIVKIRNHRVRFSLDRENRELWIEVEGEGNTSRDALTTAQDLVREISGEEPFKNVKVDERVPCYVDPKYSVSYETLIAYEKVGNDDIIVDGTSLHVSVSRMLGGVRRETAKPTNREPQQLVADHRAEDDNPNKHAIGRAPAHVIACSRYVFAILSLLAFALVIGWTIKWNLTWITDMDHLEANFKSIEPRSWFVSIPTIIGIILLNAIKIPTDRERIPEWLANKLYQWIMKQ